jgi:hypothetical protein
MKSNKTVSKESTRIELEDHYRKMLRHIQTETFLKIVNDRIVALKYAGIGLSKVGPEKPNQQTIEKHADIMQVVARIILDERTKKGRSKANKQSN